MQIFSVFDLKCAVRFTVFLTYTLSNMPCGMPSLCRPCLPAQTMHESINLLFPLFPFRVILSMRTSVYYRARRGEWRKTILSRTLICAVSLFKHKQLRLRVRTLII